MSNKLPHLIERAAAQLRKSGNIDGSIGNLLEHDKHQGTPADRNGAGYSPNVPVNLMPTTSPIVPLAIPAFSAPASDAPSSIPPPSPLFNQPPAAQPQPSNPTAEAPAVPASSATPSRLTIRIIDRAALDRAGLIDWEQTRSRISEEFRLSQRQILRNAASPESVGHGNGNLIMVTSSRPGEGKSFISLNLAASIARQRDHDVLLVDIDYKPNSIGTTLGLSGARGLLDLVIDSTLDPDQLIVKTAIDNLSILPIGQHGERSPELFASRQATRLIQSLGRRYADRLVILDAPPCLATSEPGALAPVVGQVVLVVEAEKTQREEVESALDLIQTCPTITLLLNKVKQANRHGFGAYSASYAPPYSS